MNWELVQIIICGKPEAYIEIILIGADVLDACHIHVTKTLYIFPETNPRIMNIGIRLVFEIVFEQELKNST